MGLKIVAASLVSAGLATLITARVVEDRMLKEFDQRVQEEVAAARQLFEMQEYAKKDVKATSAIFTMPIDPEEKTTLPEVKADGTKPGINEMIRYDKVVRDQNYIPDQVAHIVGEDTSDEDLADAIDEENVEIMAITTDEFMYNENGWPQASISYFADGGVLDDSGEVVVDWETMIGNTVPPFGMLSGEPHIVYLRNTKLQREFEVVRDDANAADILSGPPGSP